MLHSVGRCGGCFCPGDIAGPKCWEISFSPKFVRWYEVTLTPSSCASGCGDADKLTATIALGAMRAFGTQPVAIPRAPTAPCDCDWLCSIVDYTPEATWTAAAVFCSVDCAEGSATASGWRVVSSTNLVSVGIVSVPGCGGLGNGLQLVFKGVPASQTLTGCGSSVVMEQSFGLATAPSCIVVLKYCARAGTNTCTYDLYSVEVGGAAYEWGWGLAGGLGDCDCGDANGNVYQSITGTAGAGAEFASTGFGPIYALAGSPPLVLVCRSCAP